MAKLPERNRFKVSGGASGNARGPKNVTARVRGMGGGTAKQGGSSGSGGGGRTRTVVRARYTSGGGAKGATRTGAKAKTGLNYYTTREEDGSRQMREGFSRTEEGLSYSAMLERTQEANKSTYAVSVLAEDEATGKTRLEQDHKPLNMYEFVLSPDPAQSRTFTAEDLQSWTRSVMSELEERRGEDMKWVAVTHHYSEHPHTHVIAWTGGGPSGGKLTRDDLGAMRATGDREAEVLFRDRQVARALEGGTERSAEGPGTRPDEGVGTRPDEGVGTRPDERSKVSRTAEREGLGL